MNEPSSPPVSQPAPAPVLSAPARPATPAKPVSLARPPRLSLLARFLIALFALAALAAWLPWFLPRLAERLPAYARSQTVTPTESVTRAEFEALKAQSAQPTAATAVAAASQDDSALSPQLAPQLADLQKQLAEDKAQLAQQQANEQARQQQFASTIKGDSAQAALQAVAPLFTLSRLADKLARGTACQLELDAAGTSLSSSERASIAPLASGGPSPDSLVRQLDDQRRALLAVWRDADAQGWADKIRARLSALISIRAPDRAPDAATVAYDQLRRQLVQGDDAGALATVRALPAGVQAGLPGMADALDGRARALEAVAAAMARHAGPQPDTSAPLSVAR